jgi:3-oxoacyl-(acyl-carrier-protein) synthase
MDIAITGIGLITPIGSSLQDFGDSIINMKSGAILGDIGLIAPVTDDITSQFSVPQLSIMGRNARMAVLSTKKAIADSGVNLDNVDLDRTAIYWGSSTCAAEKLKEDVDVFNAKGRFRPGAVATAIQNSASASISIAFRITGPCLTISNACSSASASIGEVCRLLELGEVDLAISGGSDSAVSGFTYQMWKSTSGLAKPSDPVSESCKPFSKSRTGLLLGEGCGAFILERTEDAMKRGAKIYARIVGYGNRGDATHITQPSIAGQVKTMVMALKSVPAYVPKIDFISAHGTGTFLGDPVEAQSIKTVFGSGPAVSSTKALHGHLLGASGAMGILTCITALNRNVLIPQAFLGEALPEGDGVTFLSQAKEHPVKYALCNSFAFGGNNISLILTK